MDYEEAGNAFKFAKDFKAEAIQKPSTLIKASRNEKEFDDNKEENELNIPSINSNELSTPDSPYKNTMEEIKARFCEFRLLDNDQLELMLHFYENHFNSPQLMSNAAYYVTGGLIVMISLLFNNAQNFTGYDTSHFGLTPDQIVILEDERNYLEHNTPEKIIMITIMAISTSGLSYIATRRVIN